MASSNWARARDLERHAAARTELRAVGRAFTYPVLTIWRNRGLIRVMVRRDILGRYRGSFGGAFWTLINPLLLMLTYFFVFGVVLRSRFAGDQSRSGSRCISWRACCRGWRSARRRAARRGDAGAPQFVKKLVFAVETLPVNLVVAGLVSEMFAVVLFCGFLLAVRGGVPPTVLWLPALLIPKCCSPRA